MTMMMMANHAEPLDSNWTKTKYMSWVWRNGLGGGGSETMVITAERGREKEKMSACGTVLNGKPLIVVVMKFSLLSHMELIE